METEEWKLGRTAEVESGTMPIGKWNWWRVGTGLTETRTGMAETGKLNNRQRKVVLLRGKELAQQHFLWELKWIGRKWQAERWKKKNKPAKRKKKKKKRKNPSDGGWKEDSGNSKVLWMDISYSSIFQFKPHPSNLLVATSCIISSSILCLVHITAH